MTQVNTISDLAKAIVDKESEIVIEGDLSKGIVKIKATGDDELKIYEKESLYH